MKLFAISLLGLSSFVSTASAAVVYVTVTGTGRFYPPEGGNQVPPQLGTGHFTAEYSYEDSTAPIYSSIYENALLSFSMTFTGGSTFTATGGNITADNQQFSISSVDGINFPTIGGLNYTNFILFKLLPVGQAPHGRLPTATELTANYQEWCSWFSYGSSDPNRFILAHTSFTAVPEPTLPLLALSSLGLMFRRKRHRSA